MRNTGLFRNCLPASLFKKGLSENLGSGVVNRRNGYTSLFKKGLSENEWKGAG